MMSILSFEEEFLKDADKCPVCKYSLRYFKKYRAGSEYIWAGWCDKCKENKITINGNNPDDELSDS